MKSVILIDKKYEAWREVPNINCRARRIRPEMSEIVDAHNYIQIEEDIT
jgi:hypothetical protein